MECFLWEIIGVSKITVKVLLCNYEDPPPPSVFRVSTCGCPYFLRGSLGIGIEPRAPPNNRRMGGVKSSAAFHLVSRDLPVAVRVGDHPMVDGKYSAT